MDDANIPVEEAVELFNNGAAASVATTHRGAIEFQRGDTIEMVEVNERLMPCVHRNGSPVSPPDPSKAFVSELVCFPAVIAKAFVGPSSACRDISPSSKAAMYALPLEGCHASTSFFTAVADAFDVGAYARDVQAHGSHAIKRLIRSGSKVSCADKVKELAGKGKVYTPVWNDEATGGVGMKLTKRVFTTRARRCNVVTDYDTAPTVQAFLAEQRKLADSGAAGNHLINVETFPIYDPRGERVTDLDAFRGCVGVVTYRFMPDWVSKELGNVSWPGSVVALNCTSMVTAGESVDVAQPDLFALSSKGASAKRKRVSPAPDDGSETEEDEGVADFVSMRASKTQA